MSPRNSAADPAPAEGGSSWRDLAVAINGTMFTSNSFAWFRLPGDLAKGVETVVADDLWPLPTYREMLFIK